MTTHNTNHRLNTYAALAVMSIAVLGIMTLGNVPTRAQVSGFTDLPAQSPQAQIADYLAARGVISGFPDGSFRPLDAVNRAEAAKMLLLAAKLKVYDLNNSGYFKDITDDAWYADYVLSAAGYKIIQGYPDRTFRADQGITGAEFLKMISVAFQLEQNLSHNYTDVNEDDWFSAYAGAATKYQLYPDRDVTLRPNEPLTRLHVAVALYQILRFEAGEFTPTSPMTTGGTMSAASLRGAAPEEEPYDPYYIPANQESSRPSTLQAPPPASNPYFYVVPEPDYPRPKSKSSKSAGLSAGSAYSYRPETSRANECNGHPECSN